MSTTDTSPPAAPPEQPNAQRAPQQEHLLVRWFVRFNPLFTLSALCVLAGVLVLSQHCKSDDPSIGLSVVVELYQWLLIGTAALLYRRLNEHRPGVILGLIALVFLADPTLQLSALASSNHVVACGLWVVLVAAKLQALQRAFCLTLSAAARVVPVVLAAFVAVLPNARLLDDIAQAVPGLLAVGIFGIGAAGALLPITATSTRALGDVGTLMFPRLMRTAVAIAICGALFQGGNAIYAMGAVQVMPAIGACLLVVAIRIPRSAELLLWFTIAMGVGCCAMLPTISMVLGGAALAIASRQHAPRTIVVGVLMASSTSLHALRDGIASSAALHVFVVLALAAVLMAVLVRRRSPSAALALVALVAAPLRQVVWPLASTLSAGTWGIVLVGSGFTLLPLGVYAHRRLSRMVAADDERIARITLDNDPRHEPA